MTNKTIFDKSNVDINDGGEAFDFKQSQFSGVISSKTDIKSTQYTNNVSNLGNSSSEETSPTNPYGKVETSMSFGTKVIFGEVFPDDDNNRYIEMPSEDIAVIQYSEPTIKVDELNISNGLGIDVDNATINVHLTQEDTAKFKKYTSLTEFTDIEVRRNFIEAQKNKTTVFTGQTGAGKSTLLNALMRKDLLKTSINACSKRCKLCSRIGYHSTNGSTKVSNILGCSSSLSLVVDLFNGFCKSIHSR